MVFRGRVGLTKEHVRRIVLAKLRIVYRDWRVTNDPFGRRDPNAGRRREDAQSCETALVAALLGGLSEAIEKNNQALFTALGRKDRRMRMKVQAHRRKR
jgi:hypothetical protein